MENKKKKSIFKRVWFWLLLILIIALGAGSCSGGDKKEGSKKAVAESTETKASEVSGTNSEAQNETRSEKPEKGNDKATVEEQVLLEQDGIKVTLKELALDEMFGPELKVCIENSSAQNVTVQTSGVSVNGIMIESIFSCDVAAGKNANDGITLLDTDLEQAGINAIQNVELTFHVFDTDSFNTLFDSDTITISTSLDGTGEQAVDDSGVLLVDENGIKITVKEVDSENSFWGADIYIYVENNTETDVTVQAANTSINGFMVEPYFSCDVTAGKKAYDTITFMESNLEENNITSIDSMDISFHVFNTEDFNTIFDTDTLSVSFE